MALNLLALEPVLLEVLRAELPASVKVGSGANLVGRTSVAKLCPAVFVEPGDSAVLPADEDPAAGDAVTADDEVWTITVLVAFTRDASDLGADFSEAGELMGRVYNALHGLQVETYRTLTYAGRQAPQIVEPGVCALSIDFAITRAFGPDAS